MSAIHISNVVKPKTISSQKAALILSSRLFSTWSCIIYSGIPCEPKNVKNCIKTPARATNPNSFGSSCLESIAITITFKIDVKTILLKIQKVLETIFEVLLLDLITFIFDYLMFFLLDRFL